MNTFRGAGYGSRTRIPALSARGTYVAGKTHRIRTTITTAQIATARPISCPGVYSPRPCRTERSWAPIRMNTVPLMRNTRTCHAAVPATRTDELISRGALRPTQIPAETVARTPEMWNCSAGRYVATGASRVSTTEKTGSSTRRRAQAMIRPISSPNAIPPAATATNVRPAFAIENVPVDAAMIANR
jgi:hypothetical protein